MTDIIVLARKAGFTEHASTEMLERFAALVAAEAVEKEREACARVCEEQHDRARTLPGAARAGACADAIRARDA